MTTWVLGRLRIRQATTDELVVVAGGEFCPFLVVAVDGEDSARARSFVFSACRFEIWLDAVEEDSLEAMGRLPEFATARV